MRPWGLVATPWPTTRLRVRTVASLSAGLAWCVAVVAAASVVGFLLAAYFRVTYPYPMWVMEAPAVQAVRRILQGQPLYGPPTLAYVPSIYAPLYFYVSAAFAAVLGPSLATLRLVSLLASLGSASLLAHLVWRETHQPLPTLLAPALFICSTSLAANSLDLARVDPLCVLLLLAGLDAARAADGPRPADSHTPWAAAGRSLRGAVPIHRRGRAIGLSLASGVLFGLAVLTKQTALIVGLSLALQPLLSRRRGPSLAYLLGLALTVGLAALALVAQAGAWPLLYLVQLPREHALQLTALDGFWSKQLLPAFTLPLVLLPVFLIGRWLQGERGVVRFWSLAALSMLAMAWGASLNRWSADNVLLPAFAILSAGFALGIDEALQRLHRAAWPARAFAAYVLALALAEFAFVHYNPRETSPLRSDVEAGQRLVAALRALPGSVYGPDLSELLYQAGKGEQPVGLSIGELQGVFGGKPVPQGSLWSDAYAQALDQRQFDAVLLDPDSVAFFLTDSTRDHGYVDTGPLIPAGDEFYRLASPFLPNVHVWVPRERLAQPPAR